MSDTHHKEGFGEGHEIDAMPSGRLMNLLVTFTVITVMASIGVIQVFFGQREGIIMERAKQGSYLYKRYADEMKEIAEGAGPTADGKFFVSHDKARELVLADPNRLKAAAPPPGWIHPDDVQTGGAAAPPPPAPPAQPEEGADGGEEGAEEAAEGTEEAAEKEAPAEKPAAPAGDDAPAKKPKPAKDEESEPAKKPAAPKGDTKAEPKPKPKPAPAKGDPKAEPAEAKGDGN